MILVLTAAALMALAALPAPAFAQGCFDFLGSTYCGGGSAGSGGQDCATSPDETCFLGGGGSGITELGTGDAQGGGGGGSQGQDFLTEQGYFSGGGGQGGTLGSSGGSGGHCTGSIFEPDCVGTPTT